MPLPLRPGTGTAFLGHFRGCDLGPPLSYVSMLLVSGEGGRQVLFLVFVEFCIRGPAEMVCLLPLLVFPHTVHYIIYKQI